MNICREILINVLISPVIEIIVSYAMFSEAQLVMQVFANTKHQFFGRFKTTVNASQFSEWMGIRINPHTTNTLASYGVTDWKMRQCKFFIKFGGPFPYDDLVPVGFESLLPSNNFIGITMPSEFYEIFRKCEDQYLDKMRRAMAEI
jgi:hypothetical protein